MDYRKPLHPIMFVGTGSDVGKSVINTAFCRIFLQDGYTPAPFKAQNMSLNSYATPDGLEIGRAQAVQAEACGINCSVEMNPILLKPVSEQMSQVILNGKPMGNRTASEYFLNTDRDTLFKHAIKACHKLKSKYNPIVIEGAGSISEVNLWDKDITNMRIAKEIEADTFLIADIDRGGVFGSVYGTMMLLPEEHKRLIKGIIINKFRGDISLFEDGKQILEKITGIPVVAVIPYFSDIFIDDEDSVVLNKKRNTIKEGKINISVILLKHMSNFTDFNILEQVPQVNLIYSNDEQEISNSDIVIIPGSKNTIEDLIHLRRTGIAKAVLKAHKSGSAVYGICGGFQIMGEEINDPNHVESNIEIIPGLGILPVKTTITEEKKTEQCTFNFLKSNNEYLGYEIHMGETSADSNSPLCRIDGKPDGYYLNNKTWGTYIHGILDNKEVIDAILSEFNKEISIPDVEHFKNEQYDKLANWVRMHSNMEYIYKTLKQ